MTVEPYGQSATEEQRPSETLSERFNRENIEALQEIARLDPEMAERLVALWSSAHISGALAAHELPRPEYSNPFWRANLWGV